jgi:hypothetical protein
LRPIYTGWLLVDVRSPGTAPFQCGGPPLSSDSCLLQPVALGQPEGAQLLPSFGLPRDRGFLRSTRLGATGYEAAALHALSKHRS